MMQLVKGRERIIVSPVIHEQSEIREYSAGTAFGRARPLPRRGVGG